MSAATRMTGKLLDGDEVSVHLAQFETVEEARAALLALGVEAVRA